MYVCLFGVPNLLLISHSIKLKIYNDISQLEHIFEYPEEKYYQLDICANTTE